MRKNSLDEYAYTSVRARTHDRKAKSLALYRLSHGVCRTILRGHVPVLHADGDVIPPFAQIKKKRPKFNLSFFAKVPSPPREARGGGEVRTAPLVMLVGVS